MQPMHNLYAALTSLCIAAFSLPLVASDFGTTGLIDIPSARMETDTSLSTTAAYDGRHKQFALTYQATPWLEGTFRYTGFNQFFRWDRNYEVKARLLEEGRRLPQVAIGIRDLVGTGVVSSEYLVANKQIGLTDLTLGIGWGRLAGDGVFDNPLTEISQRFVSRTDQIDSEGFSGQGGDLSFGDFFSGKKIGVFGGITHRLDFLPITAIAEYNPDTFRFDRDRGGARPKSKLSYGLQWHVNPLTDLTFSYQQGDELGVSLRVRANTGQDLPPVTPPQFISSFYLPVEDLPPQIRSKNWYVRLLYDVERSGLLLFSGTLVADGTEAILEVGNLQFPTWDDAIAQLTSLADLHLPPRVSRISFVVEEAGFKTLTVRVARPSAMFNPSVDTLRRQVRILPALDPRSPNFSTGFNTGKVVLDVRLSNRFQLFDPDDPARYQLYTEFIASYAFHKNWAVVAGYSLDIDNNFDESQRKEANSQLPKVRTDVVKYLTEGESGLSQLMLEGKDTIGRSFHYRAFGGLVEDMFGAVGFDSLYWPANSRLAVGLSLAYAQQRDFDRGLGFRDYNVVSGFASVFWASPFYDYDVAVHAGRYLAKDVGGTLEIRRTFKNGWQVGVWATLTDVPFEVFGEGSFDKGLFFQFPLDGLFGNRNRSKFSTRLRPIQRDGGQRLENFSGDIFWQMRQARYDSFSSSGRLIPSQHR